MPAFATFAKNSSPMDVSRSVRCSHAMKGRWNLHVQPESSFALLRCHAAATPTGYSRDWGTYCSTSRGTENRPGRLSPANALMQNLHGQFTGLVQTPEHLSTRHFPPALIGCMKLAQRNVCEEHRQNRLGPFDGSLQRRQPCSSQHHSRRFAVRSTAQHDAGCIRNQMKPAEHHKSPNATPQLKLSSSVTSLSGDVNHLLLNWTEGRWVRRSSVR